MPAALTLRRLGCARRPHTAPLNNSPAHLPSLQIYGFSGCHRYEAHVRLGAEQILCRVRKATPQVLRMHMM